MDTFGPSLAGTHVVPVDTRTSDGRRVVGEWVYGAGVAARSGRYRHLFRPRQRLRAVLAAHPPPADLLALAADRTAGVQRRLPAGTTPSIPHRRRRCACRLGLADRRPRPGAGADSIVAGDSAGGHLAVDLLLQPDVAHPAAVALLSPLVDLTFDAGPLPRTATPRSGDPVRRRCPPDRAVLRVEPISPPAADARRRGRAPHAADADPGRRGRDARGRRRRTRRRTSAPPVEPANCRSGPIRCTSSRRFPG